MPAARSARFLITRLSAIGDCVLTMPLLCALRDHFPDALIAWVVEPQGAQLLRGHPCLDHVIEVQRGWLSSPRQVSHLRRRLIDLQIDTVIDPQSLSKSAAAGWFSGARRRIGFKRPFGRELAPWLNNISVERSVPHVLLGNLELLRPLEISSPEIRFQVPSDDKAEVATEQTLRQIDIHGEFVVIGPGASWESKRWPASRYGEIAAWLRQRHGLATVVISAGSQENAWAQCVVAGSNGHAVGAPPLSLRELAALLRRARMFVGSDSGPLHLAAGVGTPCVGLYGPTHPEISGPYGDMHRTVRAPGMVPLKSLSISFGKLRKAGDEIMRTIDVETVRDACASVLES